MKYRQCNYCVMDTTAEEIIFDENGRCHFCREAERSFKSLDKSRLELKLKKSDKYDCLIGLSGGVDSSFLLHQAVSLGLRPLCFTIDNGWNSTEADLNIMQLVEALKVPFFRYTIDLERFKELQSAFIKSGTKNIEIPTDHILMASSYELAHKHGIKLILSGGNVATESIMPRSWGYQPRDLVHIKAIYKKFTGKKLTGLPMCGLLKWNWYKWVKGIKTVYLLDYLDYHRNEAAKILSETYGWQGVGEKHEESQFTKWFQNFYLFEKFGIDKRKAHYSSMIVSGQMTRNEALERLGRNPEYPRFGLEEKVMKYPIKDYREYPNDERLFNFISKAIRLCRF